MTMSRARSVDEYIEAAKQWQPELITLRDILRETDMEESVKWGAPCYGFGTKNLVGMLGFKSYFGLWFHQGALLSDPENVLINAQQGKTQALRQWRMTGPDDIRPDVIRSYLSETLDHHRAGRTV